MARRIADGQAPAVAAQHEGVRLLQVLEWRYHPEFIAWLRVAKESKVALASVQLAGLATDAIGVLKASMQGDNPKVALDAAKEVLRLIGVEPEYMREGEAQRRRENLVAAIRFVGGLLSDPDARAKVEQLVEDV